MSVEVSVNSPELTAKSRITDIRTPTGSILSPPRFIRSVAKFCIVIFMSFRSSEPVAVYRSISWLLGASPSSSTSGFVRQVAHTTGWSRRFWPTPGRSCTTGTPTSLR